MPKDVTLAVSLINPTAALNAVTRSQNRLLIEDVKKVAEPKAKGKQVMEELANHYKLAAKLTEVFLQMKPEQPECSRAREITKIPSKPLTDPLKAPKLGYAHYIQKQVLMKEQTKNQGKTPDKVQEEAEFKKLPKTNRKVTLAQHTQQWTPVKQQSKLMDQVKEKPDGKIQRIEEQVQDVPAGEQVKHIPEQKESAKKLKRPNKELGNKQKGSIGSRKNAKIKIEWQGRITDGSEGRNERTVGRPQARARPLTNSL